MPRLEDRRPNGGEEARADVLTEPLAERWCSRWLAPLVFVAVFALGVAVEGGASGVAASAAAVAVGGVLFWRGLGVFEISVLALPVMFYVSVGTNFNISVGDIFLPLLLLQAVLYRQKLSSVRAVASTRAVVAFIVLLFFFVGVSTIASDLIVDIDSSSIRALTETSKLIVCTLYALTYLALVRVKLESQDLRFLQVWVWTAVSIAILAFGSLFLSIPGHEPFSQMRARGSFEDPNLLGAYLLCSIGFAVGYNSYKHGSPARLNVLVLMLGVIATG